MDGDQWGKWMKSMYGIKATSEPAVIIADHSRLVYYNKDASGQPIELTSLSILSALEGALDGSIRPKSSENFLEKLIRFFGARLASVEQFVVQHPYYTVLSGFAFLAAIFLALKRALGDELGDLQHDRRYHGKSSRLD
ncbi:hypothetical protein BJ138DRAFT_180025 [Hygrophoropsis aurantiaca]|uniref:Uncharacterized protein n=1 Tax=Hygrophoropsis aurantiaca TaxID=72124 RepID=A0ACB7ZQZ3_9AGAM|nr:hypothetical protein BJ138DRAFT_180025 [Hygrophoropsis aurantiaca]